MTMRRLLPVLLPVLVAWLLATSLVTVAAPADGAAGAAGTVGARRVAPAKDFPHLPRYCATPKEEIPQKAVECHLTPFVKKHPTIVLWGDSHAWMMIPALRKAVQHRNVNLVAFVMGSCPPMDPALKPGQAAVQCDHNNDMAIRYVKSLRKGHQKLAVLLGASWERYYHSLKTHDTSDYAGTQAAQMSRQTPRLFRTLARAHVSVTVDGEVPTVPESKKRCAKGQLPYSCDVPRNASLPDAKGTQKWVRRLMRPLPDKKVVSVVPALCDATVCHGLIGSVHTWFDDLHLSATRSALLASYFSPMVAEVSPTAPVSPAPARASVLFACAIPLLLC